MIYLDHAATTPVDERVMAEMLRCMRECFANPSAAYGAAGAARREQRLARRQLAQMLGCDTGEVFFTSGGTESNNWAFQAARGKHAVVSAMEHASVLEAARRWAGSVTLVQPDAQGVIHPEAVEAAIRPDTALVSVQWANNETGVLQPVEDIGRMAHSHGALFHTDAVQAFGHVKVSAACCDLLSLSAHKLYGPRGIGCLFVKSGTALSPMVVGGGQESGLRAGTENTPAICGLGMAAGLAQEDMENRAQREQALIDAFAKALPRARMLGKGAQRLPGVAAFWLPGLESEQVIAQLDLHGVCISGGAACASASREPSHVYRAMGLSEREARSVIRISVGRATQMADVLRAAELIGAL